MTPHDRSPVWEQRWHPIRGEWVLFTSQRGGRPWVGETVAGPVARPPEFDPACALCPGNPRLRGHNPHYPGVYLFTNDLPCFSPHAPTVSGGDALYRAKPARGTAEVVCYHPRHDKTFAELSLDEAASVVDLWAERTRALGAQPDVDHVLIFENKGALVGTSNPHPHCQIYAGNLVYALTAQVAEVARTFQVETGGLIGLEVLRREAAAPRVIGENASFLACVPWFARYAYEVLVLPKSQASSLLDFDPPGRRALAAILREIAIRYDNLWRLPMPYVMVLRQAPTDGKDYASFPFHIEFHPPLRKPDTRKYLAGPEIGGGTMTNESDPDEKAAELRAVSTRHYLEEEML
ncbi:MAG: galactose-1-phosphate uridylyltransferase [Chthoniobacter sp.]|nr:galactose-1-phosphate uridylyltransferase [Chthoniobacter sp.]